MTRLLADMVAKARCGESLFWSSAHVAAPAKLQTAALSRSDRAAPRIRWTFGSASAAKGEANSGRPAAAMLGPAAARGDWRYACAENGVRSDLSNRAASHSIRNCVLRACSPRGAVLKPSNWSTADPRMFPPVWSRRKYPSAAPTFHKLRSASEASAAPNDAKCRSKRAVGKPCSRISSNPGKLCAVPIGHPPRKTLSLAGTSATVRPLYGYGMPSALA